MTYANDSNKVDGWDQFAAAAEAGELAPIPGTAVHGEDAAAAGRAMILAATGASTIEDATQIALGRPRLGEDRAETVTWRVRATGDLDLIVTQLADREGRSRSALIRAAVLEYARARTNA